MMVLLWHMSQLMEDLHKKRAKLEISVTHLPLNEAAGLRSFRFKLSAPALLFSLK